MFNVPFKTGVGLPKLAPDLNFVSNSISAGYKQITSIDATGSLTEILSLTGKFSLELIAFTDLTNNDMSKIKLTIDGVDIWNEDPLTIPSGTSYQMIGRGNDVREFFLVEEALSLSVEMATDNDITLQYLARPIL